MYEDRAKELDAEQWQRARRSMKEYVRSLTSMRRFREGMRFLDIGGGLGYYAAAAQETGFETTMLEVDPVSVSFAREHHTISAIIEAASAEDARIRSESYDVIFARHVIEHMEDPRSFLRQASRCLHREGVLILETDNNRAPEMLLKPGTCNWYLDLYRQKYMNISWWRLLRARPFAADPPRHLFAFSISNLQLLLRDCGFEVHRAFTYRLGDPVYWPNLPDSGLKEVFGALAGLHLRSAANHFIDLMLAPVRRMLPLFGMAAGICIYATKR